MARLSNPGVPADVPTCPTVSSSPWPFALSGAAGPGAPSSAMPLSSESALIYHQHDLADVAVVFHILVRRGGLGERE